MSNPEVKISKYNREKTPEEQMFRSQLGEFREQLNEAKANHDTWLEVSEEVMKYYNPRGLGGNDYFVLEGVKITTPGNAEKIEAREAMSIDMIDFKGAARVDGR